MKTMIFAALTILVLGAAAAQAGSADYHTPAHNYYQNNWMAGGG
jgi:hypothetical protein